MPTNFGDLPTNQPAPVAHGSRSFAWVGTSQRVNNTWAVGTPLPNGAGGIYQIAVTPSKRAFWVVEATMLLASPDAVWSQVAFTPRLNPADLDGNVIGNYVYGAVHASVPWRTFQSSFPFRLEAGVAYTATMCFEYSSNNNQDYHQHPYHMMLSGVLVGESVV